MVYLTCKTMRRGALRTLAAAALLAMSAAAGAFQDEGTVRVGMLEAQTGTYAPFGLANMWGTLVAFDEINAAGGVTVGGKKVKIAVTPSPHGYDAGNDPAQSVSLLKKLVAEDKVLMVKGISNSNAGTAVYGYLAELEKQGTPIVVHSSSVGTPGLTLLSKYAFRNSFIENTAIVGLTKEVQKQTGAKTAAFFVIKDNPYYSAITEKSVMPVLKSLGIEVVAVTEAVTADRDFSRQANEMRNAKPDIIYVMAPPLSALSFLKEAKRRQVAPKIYVGNISLMTTETLQSGGDAVEGMVMAAAYDPQSSKMAAFGAEYKKRYGQDINMFSVTGYEAGFLIAKAIEQSGIANTPASLQEDRTKFRNALATVSIHSPTGEVAALNADRETPKNGTYLIIRNNHFTAWKGAGS
jgi:branched-chain amino acid transport system substrate-binding protein